MILTRVKITVLLLVTFVLGLATACNQSFPGNISGKITQDGTSASIDVNFTSLSFPSTTASNTLLIKLSNASGHEIQFTLAAKNTSGANLAAQFPTGSYIIDGSTNQFSGTLPFVSTQTTDVTSTNGIFNLTSFQVGTDASGNPAVAIIAATFELNLEGGGILDGSLEKDFTQ